MSQRFERTLSQRRQGRYEKLSQIIQYNKMSSNQKMQIKPAKRYHYTPKISKIKDVKLECSYIADNNVK